VYRCGTLTEAAVALVLFPDVTRAPAGRRKGGLVRTTIRALRKPRLHVKLPTEESRHRVPDLLERLAC
jgi:hypothetical protein